MATPEVEVLERISDWAPFEVFEIKGLKFCANIIYSDLKSTSRNENEESSDQRYWNFDEREV